MADSSLEERVRDHEASFKSLLGLIPAKVYYGDGDTSNQHGRKKKKSKAERAAAKRGRLDPDSALNRNAQEVMEERARNKRKLEDLGSDGDDGEIEGVEREQPGEGMRKPKARKISKKQKLDEAADDNKAKAENKRQARKEKKEKKRQENLEQKRQREATGLDTVSQAPKTEPSGKPSDAADTPRVGGKGTVEKRATKATITESTDGQIPPIEPRTDAHGGRAAPGQPVDAPDEMQSDGGPSDWASTSEPQSPIFDTEEPGPRRPTGTTEAASTTTSVSSIVAPSEKPKHIKVPEDTTLFRQRLAERIAKFRADRKADGPTGQPPRTRQELIEQRRQRQAQRKEHKKELRRQAKLQEEQQREEVLALNSPMSPAVDLDETAANLAFGRVAFTDGAQLSRDLSYVLNRGSKKGRTDPKSALLKLQNDKRRLAELDEAKRTDIEDKESWLTARRRAEGQKVHNDESLLQKAVKRKERSKQKSEREWKERTHRVEVAQRERQKKREDNLRKRREDKMLGKAGRKKAAKKARPGFEGRFGGGGKKKPQKKPAGIR